MPDALTAPAARRSVRLAILAATFLCAACGLVYELALIALGSYLVGSSITQTSIVVAVFMCSMGLGALGAKSLVKRPIGGFLVIETTLALVGGLSVPLLYLTFAYVGVVTPAIVLTAIGIGALIGAEIPLLMELIQRDRQQVASHAVADLSAVDYVGALLGGLAFPFLLLPVFGLLRGTILVGLLNVVVGIGLAVLLLRRSGRGRHLVAAVGVGAVVAALLGSVLFLASDVETTGRQVLYDDPIVFVERSAYQEIVMTKSSFVNERAGFRLFLNGDLQFASADEYRYHEALVHPAMSGPRARVLILGGGDGLAAREVLRYTDVAEVTMVELDPRMTELAAEHPLLVAQNAGSMRDPRLNVINTDAFTWARAAVEKPDRWDVIVVDFPDPDSMELAKLYSLEMASMTSALLTEGGRLTMQAGSPYFAPDSYWCVVSTVEAAGLRVTPFHVDVPSFGDWGFVLGARNGAPPVTLAPERPADLRFLEPPVLAASTVFPPDTARRPTEVSTLLDPQILRYQRTGWQLD